MLHKSLLENVVNRDQIILRAFDQPVGHGLTGNGNTSPAPFLLLPIQRYAHDEFLRQYVRNSFRRCNAPFDQWHGQLSISA